MKITLTTAPQKIVDSLWGSGGRPTKFTGTLVGAGTMYVALTQADCTSATGVPFTAGLYVSETLVQGGQLWACMDSGTGDLRVLDAGAN